jgi:hypothetical protein
MSRFVLGLLVGALLANLFISATVGNIGEIKASGGVILDPAKLAENCGAEWVGEPPPGMVGMKLLVVTSSGYSQCREVWVPTSDPGGWEVKITP